MTAETVRWKKERLTDGMVTILMAACIKAGLDVVFHNPPSDLACVPPVPW
jgi:hypothetical protein